MGILGPQEERALRWVGGSTLSMLVLTAPGDEEVEAQETGVLEPEGVDLILNQAIWDAIEAQLSAESERQAQEMAGKSAWRSSWRRALVALFQREFARRVERINTTAINVCPRCHRRMRKSIFTAIHT